MTLNLTINEAAAEGQPPATPGTFVVSAFFSELAGGQEFGPFSTREAAERCAVALAARPGVVKAIVSGG